MNLALAPFIVEGTLVVFAGLFGFLLRRSGRPLGKVKLGFHLFFFVWLAFGYYYILAASLGTGPALLACVLLMGLGLLVQLVAGILLLAARQPEPRLRSLHKVSAFVILIADLGALLLTALR